MKNLQYSGLFGFQNHDKGVGIGMEFLSQWMNTFLPPVGRTPGGEGDQTSHVPVGRPRLASLGSASECRPPRPDSPATGHTHSWSTGQHTHSGAREVSAQIDPLCQEEVVEIILFVFLILI